MEGNDLNLMMEEYPFDFQICYSSKTENSLEEIEIISVRKKTKMSNMASTSNIKMSNEIEMGLVLTRGYN